MGSAEGPDFPSAEGATAAAVGASAFSEVVAFSAEGAGAAAFGKCSLVRAATSAVAAPVWVQVSGFRVSCGDLLLLRGLVRMEEVVGAGALGKCWMVMAATSAVAPPSERSSEYGTYTIAKACF